MKTKKSNKLDFIESLLNSDELSYEDYLKLKKLEDLYLKAKEKYNKKKVNNTIYKKYSKEDSKEDTFHSKDYSYKIYIDNNSFTFDKDSPSYRRAQEFKQYMDDFSAEYDFDIHEFLK